jgi:hypothetical protein
VPRHPLLLLLLRRLLVLLGSRLPPRRQLQHLMSQSL